MTGSSGSLRLFPVLLVALAVLGGARGQDRPRVEASLESDRIYEGESVLYTVEVLGTPSPQAPDLTELSAQFHVEPRGEQSLNSSFTRIINGKIYQEEKVGRSYRFLLTPRESGTLAVPAPRVEVDGETFRGKALRLEVIPPPDQDLVRLSWTIDPPSVYPMQKFQVKLRVYIRSVPSLEDRDPIDLTQPVDLTLPSAEPPDGLEPVEELSPWLSPRLVRTTRVSGFHINQIPAPQTAFSLFGNPAADRLAVFNLSGRRVRDAAERASIPSLPPGDATYWVYSLDREFSARRSGRFALGPVTFKGLVPDRYQGGRLQGQEIYATSPPLTILIRPVPAAGRPPSYTGAIGRFQLGAQVAPRKLHVGDPMTLTLTLSGEGNLGDVGPPDLQQVPALADHFQLYEATSETKAGKRIFTYSLRPTTESVQEIPPIPLAYFDVSSESFLTLETPSLPIVVERAERLSTADIVSAGRPEATSPEQLKPSAEGLFANVTDSRDFRDESIGWKRHAALLASLSLGYGALAAGLVRLRKRRQDPRGQRRRAAAARARAQWKAARALDDAPGFAAAATATFAGLVADVAGIPAAGLTAGDVLRHAEAASLEQDLRDRLRRFLQQLDSLQYGGATATAVQELTAQGETLLSEWIAALQRGGHLS